MLMKKPFELFKGTIIPFIHSDDLIKFWNLNIKMQKWGYSLKRFTALIIQKFQIILGKWQTCWREVDMWKDPLDLVIVQQLLWELKPRTVIEFGAYKGGSALWTADMLKMFGCKSRVISVDIDLSLLDPEAKKSLDMKVIEGDIMQVEKLFPEEFLKVGKKIE